MSPSGAQLEEARMRAKLAALPLLIQDPVRARLEGQHQMAHAQLERTAALAVSDLTARRARNRLRQIRALMAFLNRTDHHHTEGIPCREERERLIGPVLTELANLAHRAQPRRPRQQPTPITKTEIIHMTNPVCIVEGHPHHASGCILEGGRDEPVKPATNGHALSGLPLDLANEVADWERNFLAPNFSAVREAKCDRLTRYLLDRPAAAQRTLLAAVFYQLGLRLAGRR